jgi:transposase
MTDNRKEQTSDWREVRRLQAWELKKKGWTQSKIAEALGVTRGAVSQWIKQVREGGVEALRHRKGGGSPPGLTEEQLKRLPVLLAKGAEAYGFRGDVWTRARAGVVIEQEFGVSYTPQHVGRILDKINWSRQKPVEQASQRDEAAIERWRTEKCRELKKKPKSRVEP